MDFAYCTIALLEVCLAVAKPCQSRSKIRHCISPCRVLPPALKMTSRGGQQKKTMTPSSVAAPKQSGKHVLLPKQSTAYRTTTDHHSTLQERTQRSRSRLASSLYRSFLNSFSSAFMVDCISLRISIFFLALVPSGKRATRRRLASCDFSCNFSPTRPESQPFCGSISIPAG